MDIVITAPDGIVLRDGKPFGESGTSTGGYYNWPLPQTLAGMVRSAVGLNRDPDYFQTPGNAEKLLAIGIGPIHPVLVNQADSSREPLFPVPADLLFLDKSGGEITLQSARMENLSAYDGGYFPIKDPLIPIWPSADKPSRQTPFWLRERFFQAYLQENLPSKAHPRELGLSAPVTQDSMHNSIENGCTKEHSLYQTRYVHFQADHYELGIQLTVSDVEEHDLPDTAYLGGERRRVRMRAVSALHRTCPEWFKGQRYLKLVLSTHGNFGGWAPQWLLNSSDWTQVPDTTFEVRLRSAVMGRWQPVSGWDYARRGPKALRKLVPPGSIYLIELKDLSTAQNLANHLWNHPLEQNQTARDGFGRCYVGLANQVTASQNS